MSASTVSLVSAEPSFNRSWGVIWLRILLEGFFLLAFTLVTFSLYIIIFPDKGIAATIAANYLLAGYYIRVLLCLTTIFLSPGRPALRILPFSDTTAKLLYLWSSILFIVEILLARSAINMRITGTQETVLLAVNGLIIVSSMIMFAAMIIQSRCAVTEYIFPSLEQQAQDSLTCRLARHWHLPAFFLLFFVAVIWEIRVLDSVKIGMIHFGKIIVAMLVTPVFFPLISGGKDCCTWFW